MVPSRVAASVVQRHVKHVRPVAVGEASGVVARVYEQVADEMRVVIPPAQLHSPAPDLLAAYWMLMREPLLPTRLVSRAVKEAVAAAVSIANICPYCAEMHGVSLYDLGTEHDSEAIARDDPAGMEDPRLRAAAEWARHAHETAEGPAPLPDPRPGAAAELVGVLVALHYLCRMVNVFLSPFLLPPSLGPRARRRAKQGIGRLMRPTLRDPREAGRSVGLLPPADPSRARGGLWAAGNTWVADAYARASDAFDAAGERSVPPAVRQVVAEFLDGWQGQETGISTAWCDRLVSGLPAAEAVSARLALLTCAASYQVDEVLVGEFRAVHPGDGVVLDTVAWASFAAARVIGDRQPAGTAFQETRGGAGPLHDEGASSPWL